MDAAVRNSNNVFCIHFILISIILFGIFGLLPDNLYTPITNFSASLVHRFLNLLGYTATHHQNYLNVEGFSVKVIPECTAVFIIILYTAFIVSFPVPWERKWRGLSYGIPILFIVNQFRLTLLCVVGLKWPQLFELTHVYAGQIFLTTVLILIIFLWLQFSMTDLQNNQSLLFTVRFLTISSLLFIPWIYLNAPYMRCLDFIIKTAFSIFGRHLTFSVTTEIYYETFNFIIFTGLILSPQNMHLKKQLRYLIYGLIIIMAGHLGIRFANIFNTAFGSQSAIFIQHLLHMATVYLMPVLLWVYYRHQYAHYVASLPCPICGKHKRNMVEHIRNVHGERALSSTKVQAYLNDKNSDALRVI